MTVMTNMAEKRKINDTVRYALACEFRRATIRRDDINKKILQERTRMFKAVHAGAQQKLRHLFGVEMVELGQKEKPAVGSKENTAKAIPTTRSYILRSILPTRYNDPQVIKRSDQEYEMMGILYVILSLIFTNERTMQDATLNEHLDRLNVADSSPLFGDREKLLETFVRQNYLHRTKVGDDASGSEIAWEYYWGPRAKAEIKEETIVDFISSFYGSEPNEALTSNIYKSAGYDL
ncbi:MAGE homology domain-containing protein [Dichotomocladium elegans]|nr:MAGE homology domain-containing protein [Dichotomocladium elegans]